jgi:CRP-like cAMP-binding protein
MKNKNDLTMKGESLVEKRTGSLHFYGNDELIFSENSAGKEIYIIRSGKVEISQVSDGTKMPIAVLGEGGFFVDMASITGSLRSATATAVGNVCLVSLSTEEMFRRHTETDNISEVAVLQRPMDQPRIKQNQRLLEPHICESQGKTDAE